MNEHAVVNQAAETVQLTLCTACIYIENSYFYNIAVSNYKLQLHMYIYYVIFPM